MLHQLPRSDERAFLAWGTFQTFFHRPSPSLYFRSVDLAINCYGCHVLQNSIVSELLLDGPAQPLVNKHASHVWSKVLHSIVELQVFTDTLIDHGIVLGHRPRLLFSLSTFNILAAFKKKRTEWFVPSVKKSLEGKWDELAPSLFRLVRLITKRLLIRFILRWNRRWAAQSWVCGI